MWSLWEEGWVNCPLKAAEGVKGSRMCCQRSFVVPDMTDHKVTLSYTTVKIGSAATRSMHCNIRIESKKERY